MKKSIKEWKWAGLGFFCVLFVGFLLRFLNLTKLPVFVDEAIYVRWAQVMAWEPTLRFLPLSDGKQPLFMWILMFLIKHFSDPLFIGRLVSVICGVGTMLGIFVFSYLLFKNKLVSIFSVFIYAISPFAVFFDRMALVDSMLSMFGLWSVISAYLAFKHQRLDYFLLTGFFLGFAVLTKSSALFFALLIPVFAIFVKWPKAVREKIPVIIKLLMLLFSSYILAFGMYNIQRLGPNFELLSLRTKDYINPLSHVLQRPFDPLIPYLKDYIIWIWTMGTGVLITFFAISIFGNLKKHFYKVLVLLIFAFVPVVVQAEFAKVFTARYVFFTLPYFFIFCSTAFIIKEKNIKYLLYLLLLVFVIWSSIFNYHLLTKPQKANLPRGERSGYLEEWTAGQGIKEVADYLRLEELKDPGKQIVVGTEGYFGTLPNGLQIYLNDIPNIIVVGVGVIIEDTPNSLIEALGAGNKTYLVINKSRFKGDAEKQNMKLIAKYPKALRLTDSKQYAIHGPYEELLFFELKK